MVQERYLDDNGNFVTIARKVKSDTRDREILVLKSKLKNTEIALKGKQEETRIMRGQINEANPLEKEAVMAKDKTIAALKKDIDHLLNKEMELKEAKKLIKDLEKEVKVLNQELTVKHNNAKSKTGK